MDLFYLHSRIRTLMRGNMREALAGQFTYTRGRLPSVWEGLQRDEEIRWVFNRFEEKGLVRISMHEDDLSFDDLFGDCYDDTIDHGINPNVVRKQRKEAERRLEQEGQWFVVAEHEADDPFTWDEADSIGGFIGNDFEGSGYETDLYLSALSALFKCRGACLPDYVPSKTGAWAKAVVMGWDLIGGNHRGQ